MKNCDICNNCKWFVYEEGITIYGCIGLKPRSHLFPIWFVRKDKNTCSHFEEKEKLNEKEISS